MDWITWKYIFKCNDDESLSVCMSIQSNIARGVINLLCLYSCALLNNIICYMSFLINLTNSFAFLKGWNHKLNTRTRKRERENYKAKNYTSHPSYHSTSSSIPRSHHLMSNIFEVLFLYSFLQQLIFAFFFSYGV